jgi:hypothetical protein
MICWLFTTLVQLFLSSQVTQLTSCATTVCIPWWRGADTRWEMAITARQESTSSTDCLLRFILCWYWICETAVRVAGVCYTHIHRSPVFNSKSLSVVGTPGYSLQPARPYSAQQLELLCNSVRALHSSYCTTTIVVSNQTKYVRKGTLMNGIQQDSIRIHLDHIIQICLTTIARVHWPNPHVLIHLE